VTTGAEALEAAATIQAWAAEADLKKVALAKLSETLTDRWEMDGVTTKMIKVVYVRQVLILGVDHEGSFPYVDVFFILRLKKKPYRDFPDIGNFTASFKLDGFLFSSKFTIDRKILSDLATWRAD